MSQPPPPPAGAAGPVQKVFTSEWQDSWTDCSADSETCLLSCCCPCVQFGRNYAVARSLTYGALPERVVEDNRGACCAAALFHMAAAYFCGCLGTGVVGCFVRQEVKKKYGITTGECSDSTDDFMLHCCCQPCALAQEWRELKFRADQPAAIAVPGGSIVATRVAGALSPPVGVAVAAACPQPGPAPAQAPYGSGQAQAAYAQPIYVSPAPQAQAAYHSPQSQQAGYPAQQQHAVPGGPPPQVMSGPQHSPAPPPAYNPNHYPGNAPQQHMHR